MHGTDIFVCGGHLYGRWGTGGIERLPADVSKLAATTSSNWINNLWKNGASTWIRYDPKTENVHIKHYVFNLV